MDWTTSFPSQSGWYWFRFDPAQWPGLPAELYAPQLLIVLEHQGQWYCEDTVNRERYTMKHGQGYWAGPIEPPSICGGAATRHAPIPIGVPDRTGRPIHLGDRLRFDATEWGGPCEFTLTLSEGRLQHPGSSSDLTHWCTVIMCPHEQKGGATPML